MWHWCHPTDHSVVLYPHNKFICNIYSSTLLSFSSFAQITLVLQNKKIKKKKTSPRPFDIQFWAIRSLCEWETNWNGQGFTTNKATMSWMKIRNAARNANFPVYLIRDQLAVIRENKTTFTSSSINIDSEICWWWCLKNSTFNLK